MLIMPLKYAAFRAPAHIRRDCLAIVFVSAKSWCDAAAPPFVPPHGASLASSPSPRRAMKNSSVDLFDSRDFIDPSVTPAGLMCFTAQTGTRLATRISFSFDKAYVRQAFGDGPQMLITPEAHRMYLVPCQGDATS